MKLDKIENNVSYSYESHVAHKRYLDTLKQDFISKHSIDIIDQKSVYDFDIIKTLGVGAFGIVFLVRDKSSFEYHAMKSLEKASVVKKNNVKQLLQEKKLMQCADFPFIVTLNFCCKDNLYIYLVMPYEAGGEMYTLLKKLGNFSEHLAQFYAAQVVLALEYMHHCNIIHRDIKPENIFINESGYIKLGDFGFCKIIKNRTWTLCGTPDYIAPEIILSKGYSYSVDWWSCGVLIFEMNAGYPPFFSLDTLKLYEKILRGCFKAPDHMTPTCKSLLKSLLNVDPAKRFGSLKSGVYDIKSHIWFHETDWYAILHRNVPPIYMPSCKNTGETYNFQECDDAKLKTSKNCIYKKEFELF